MIPKTSVGYRFTPVIQVRVRKRQCQNVQDQASDRGGEVPEIDVADRDVNPKGRGKASQAGEQPRPPQPARTTPVPPKSGQQHRQAIGHESAAQAGPIVGDERHVIGICPALSALGRSQEIEIGWHEDGGHADARDIEPGRDESNPDLSLRHRQHPVYDDVQPSPKAQDQAELQSLPSHGRPH